MNRLRIVSALVLALAAAAWSTPGRAQKVTMGSVGSASASLWPVYIGIKNGFFDAEGVQADLVFAPSNAGVNQQVAAGSLDLGLNSGLVDPIRAIDKGAPAVIVRLEISPAPYAILSKPTIGSMADLKGKRITVGGAKDITRILTDRMLQANGVDPQSVEYSYAGSTSARLSALQSGAVDAAIVLPPYNFYGESAGFKRLALIADVVKDMPFAGMVANSKWAAANGPTLQKVLRVYDKSIAWFYDPANRARAVDIMVEVSKGERADVERTYEFMSKGHFYAPTSDISKRQLELVVNALVEIGDLEKPLPVEKLVLDSRRLTD